LFSGLKIRRSARDPRAGYTLLELVVVLGVMGIVLSALWGVVSIVQEQVKRHQVADQIVVTVGKIRDYYAARRLIADDMDISDYPELTDYLLRNNVLLPEQIRDRTAATWVADHPWGSVGADGSVLANGGFAVGGYDRNNALNPESFFTIRLTGLGLASCIALVPLLSGSGIPERLDALVVNSTVYDPPVSPDVAVTECAAPAGATNTIELVYFLRRPAL